MPPILKIGMYITIGLVIFMFLRKRQPRPSTFNMEGWGKVKNQKSKLKGVKKVEATVEQEARQAPLEDVIRFEGSIYNIWEVLGVPFGAPPSVIRKGYEARVAEGKVNRKLLDRALEAVLEN